MVDAAATLTAKSAWFYKEIEMRYMPGGTLIIMCHKSLPGSVILEWGMPAAIREVLSDCQGDLWMIACHTHQKEDVCCREEYENR